MTTVPIPNLVQCLATALERERDTEPRRELHASDLAHALPGEGCPRQLWMRLRGLAERPPSLGELLMWDQGFGLQDRCDTYLRSTLPELHPGWTLDLWEQSLTGLLVDDFRGTVDRVLRHESGEMLVLDYKTARGRAFNYLLEPKPSHRIQVQCYAMGLDAGGAMILYADREGQNGFRQFFVQRDDDAVREAAAKLRAIQGLRDAKPPVLEPVIERRENKGPDSVYVKMPWQCEYCSFRDVTCQGALTPDQRVYGICARVKKQGGEESLEILQSPVARIVGEWFERQQSEKLAREESDLPF